MRSVVILGLTGSIGTTALNGCNNNKESVKIVGASCHHNVQKALDLCVKNNISNLCITDSNNIVNSNSVKIWSDLRQMLESLNADVVLNGISGSAGLEASLDVIESGSELALANKESIVLGGKWFFNYAKKNNVKIVPVDSEHSAIDELIQTNGIDNTSSLIITASGGPFLNTPKEELDNITPEVAIKHPTWNMGPKISIDSSTLANKGLEVIEAHYLFGFDAKNIEVVVHPQSIVHSMIRTTSGQVYAQMSPPDMTFPIMRALLDKKFAKPVGQALDFTKLNLTFQSLDTNQFPFVKDAFECIKKEGVYPIIYNIADEKAVEAFISGKIKYSQIHNVVSKALDMNWNYKIDKIHDVIPVLQDVSNRIVV